MPRSVLPPKPRSELKHPDLTRMPELTWWRRLFRRLVNSLAWFVVQLCARAELHGLHNLPKQGPMLIAVNHLGDADVVLGIAYFPGFADILAKIELYHYPILGRILDLYGVIWIHRGQPDRKAIRAALKSLQAGRFVGIAPEARESLSGALEEGTEGAAYLALKAGVPVLPVTFTGTENWRVYHNLKHLRRSRVTMTIGPPFRLEALPDHHQAIWEGTRAIMVALARQLPTEYRGVYQ